VRVRDLTESQWLEVTKASVYLPQDSASCVGRFIALDKLKAIIRRRRRSADQNALLWALYDDVLERGGESLAGWTKEDLHSFFLIEHFGADTIEIYGRKRLKPKHRSSSLTKTEFSDFIDHIVRFMAEHGVVLDLPGDPE
jgi:hypothetical protein